MKYTNILLTVFAASSLWANAQTTQTQAQPTQSESRTQPIELPNVIIEGKEQINVQSGVKQFPDRPTKLTGADIDSINPPQKLRALLLPTKTMPTELIDKTYKKGYLRADIGNYLTANVAAGYETSSREYSFLGKGWLNYSDGHVKDADYAGGGVDLKLLYIAPKKFWIFGGSKTTGNVAFGLNSYNMYGMDSVIARDAMTLNLSVKSEGEYSGYDFLTGAGFRTFGLDHGDKDGSDNKFNAFLKLKTLFDRVEVNALADIELHGIGDNSTNLFEIGAGAKFLLDEMTFDINGVFQSVGSTDNIQRANVKLDAGFDYRISPDFTAKVKLLTGFDNQQLYDLWQYNRYLNNTPTIDFSYDKAITAYLQYHPTQIIMASAGLKLSAIDRFKYFVPDSLNIFDLKYSDADAMAIFAKASIDLTEIDMLYGEIQYENRTLSDSNDSKVPYIPAFKAEIAYDRKWTEKLGTHIEVEYAGKRYADVENEIELDSFIFLNFGVDYELQQNLKIFGRLENLLNSEIYKWNNYKEREIYISAGLLWQF